MDPNAEPGSELQTAWDYFEGVLPNTSVITIGRGHIEAVESDRLIAAGLGLVEVITPDDEYYVMTYVREQTPEVWLLERLEFWANNDSIDPRTHDSAIDSIKDGSFETRWGSVLNTLLKLWVFPDIAGSNTHLDTP